MEKFRILLSFGTSLIQTGGKGRQGDAQSSLFDILVPRTTCECLPLRQLISMVRNTDLPRLKKRRATGVPLGNSATTAS